MNRNREIIGYIVLKNYMNKEEKIGHIVDLFTIDDPHIVSSLVKMSFGYFLRQNIFSVTGWFNPESLYSQYLKNEGFKEVGVGQNFGVRIFDGLAGEMASKTNSLQNWYLTMSDSDVF